MYKANELKKAYEKEKGFTYDGVIRFRPDILVPKPIYFKEYSNPTIYAPLYSTIYDISDVLAFGPSHLMDIYCNFYHHQEEICKDPRIGALLSAMPLGLYIEKYIQTYTHSSFNFDKNPVCYIQIMP